MLTVIEKHKHHRHERQSFDLNSAVGKYVWYPKGKPDSMIYVWDGTGSDAKTIGGGYGEGSTGYKITGIVNDTNGNPWLQVDLTYSSQTGENGNVGFIPVFGDTSNNTPSNTVSPQSDSIFVTDPSTINAKQKADGGGGGTPGKKGGGGGMGFLTAWNPFKIHLKGDATTYHDWIKMAFWIILAVVIAKLIYNHYHKK